MTFVALVVALLVKPSAVVGVGYLATTALRRAVAPVRHAMWLVVIAVILALPALQAVLPSIRLGIFERATRALAAPSSIARQPIAGGESTARRARQRPSAPDAVPNDTSPDISRLMGLLGFAVWVTGALLLIRRRVSAERRAVILAADAGPIPERIRRIAMLACERWRTPEVDIRGTDRVPGPVVIGLRKSVILLPESIDTCSDADLETILLHEVGHVKRRDCLTNFIADLASCLYWWNPLVRRAAARMQLEGERACDEGVVRAGADVVAYAHLLLQMARTKQESRSLTAAASAMSRARELESRIVALLHAPDVQPLGSRRSAIGLTIGVALTLPAAALTPAARNGVAPAIAIVRQDRDTVASPESERIPVEIADRELADHVADVLAGEDAALAVPFIEAMGRKPLHQYDLVADRARWVLARSSRGKLVEPLIESLHDPDWRVQAYAAWALGTVHDPRAVPTLVRLVRHPVWRLRAMAAYALAAAGPGGADPGVGGVLRDALHDSAWQVREQAVRYFARIDSDEARELVRRARTDEHVAVRIAAQQMGEGR